MDVFKAATITGLNDALQGITNAMDEYSLAAYNTLKKYNAWDAKAKRVRKLLIELVCEA